MCKLKRVKWTISATTTLVLIVESAQNNLAPLLIHRGYPHDINLISVRMSRRLHYSLVYLCPRNTSSVIPTIIIQTIKFILLGVSVSTSISSGIVKVHMLHGNYSVVDLVRSLFLFGGLRLWGGLSVITSS